MQGRDKFITGYWEGLICEIIIDKPKTDGKEIEKDLTDLKNLKRVANTDIVADSDGLGAYLESYIKNIKTFHGGAKPFNKKEFYNLKSECAFKLAEKINKKELLIKCSSAQEEIIKREISICLKRDNVDTDKKRIIKKNVMKLNLGHSPDYLDVLIMGMIFYIKEKRRGLRAV